MENVIDHKQLFRLPWTLPDNAISWLEPTSACNLACDGCYRENVKDSHKTMEEVKRELDVFQRLRKSDCISIAGGDPLLYPNIVELVAEIKARGIKPIINTNGKALTRELLHELKLAGVYGFTFHVDSKQGRPGEWKGKNELELNDLRLQYAQMLADEGGIACSFNSTVYDDTLQYVPGMIEWAHKHIDIVHTMVFIAFRHVVPEMPFDWYAGGQKVDWQKIMYHSDEKRKVDIKSTDMLKIAREKFPEFTPAAYLNGTEQPDSFKWLLTNRIGNNHKIFGYFGPKMLELVMFFYHFTQGTYLSYAAPKTTKLGRSTLFFLWLLDKGVRNSFKKYLGHVLRNPLRLFKKAHMQSILFIQPVDFDKWGNQNMCDGCPDITVHEDRLVWSCRLEEPKQFGTFLRSFPKN
ncbi:MAG: radical SAM protein [Melioribacteraceae bacterium]|nr:MAG: radical SAM protein [Melioribacteraceae bacterium]